MKGWARIRNSCPVPAPRRALQEGAVSWSQVTLCVVDPSRCPSPEDGQREGSGPGPCRWPWGSARSWGRMPAGGLGRGLQTCPFEGRGGSVEAEWGPARLCRLSAHQSLTRHPGSRTQMLESVFQTLPGSPLHSLRRFSSTTCLRGSGLQGAGMSHTRACKRAPQLGPQRRKARCACPRQEGPAPGGAR